MDTRPDALLRALHALAEDASADRQYAAAIAALRTSAEIQSVLKGGLPVPQDTNTTLEEQRAMVRVRQAAEAVGLKVVEK